MADEALTAAELESLLGRKSPSPAAAAPRASDAAEATILPFAHSVPRLDDAFAQRLAKIHEHFARIWSGELSAQLRRTVRVRLLATRETTAGAFLDELGSPVCLGLLTSDRAAGKWWLQIDGTVLYPMIDSLLGGGRDASPPVRRPPTEIELRLAMRLVSSAAAALANAWQSAAVLALEVERTVGNVAEVPLAERSLPLVVVAFEATVGLSQGTVQLALPLEQAAKELESVRQQGAGTDSAETPAAKATVELSAHLPDLEVSEAEIESLAIGDIIETDHPTSAPIEVTENGQLRHRARLGSLAGHKALEIEQSDPPQKDAP